MKMTKEQMDDKIKSLKEDHSTLIKETTNLGSHLQEEDLPELYRIYTDMEHRLLQMISYTREHRISALIYAVNKEFVVPDTNFDLGTIENYREIFENFSTKDSPFQKYINNAVLKTYESGIDIDELLRKSVEEVRESGEFDRLKVADEFDRLKVADDFFEVGAWFQPEDNYHLNLSDNKVHIFRKNNPNDNVKVTAIEYAPNGYPENVYIETVDTPTFRGPRYMIPAEHLYVYFSKVEEKPSTLEVELSGEEYQDMDISFAVVGGHYRPKDHVVGYDSNDEDVLFFPEDTYIYYGCEKPFVQLIRKEDIEEDRDLTKDDILRIGISEFSNVFEKASKYEKGRVQKSYDEDTEIPNAIPQDADDALVIRTNTLYRTLGYVTVQFDDESWTEPLRPYTAVRFREFLWENEDSPFATHARCALTDGTMFNVPMLRFKAFFDKVDEDGDNNDNS